ncbi:Crp/Fnr family transcriptional regulator [Aquabacterium sp.]|uniref:Crp/Fnr family transcriptional regulator n=1 Tax=Aquabacterium sp. TaxID=1872578 RepID=UPI002C960BA0|nr:Crp/Fnr family transcriptional regulator [Aquabacterium sp.]HSW04014.1 Crp/Fnr family transcriptional regulator [Aquabacterium sp.]
MPDPSVPAEIRSALLSDDWFRSCPPRLQDALIAHARERRLQAGEHLFMRGMPDADLYCVLAGSLCVQSVDLEGEGEIPVLVVLEPYHWFGELSLIDRTPRSHDALAETEAAVLRVPRAALEMWLSTNPEHWRDIARLAAGKLRIAYRVMDVEMRRPLTERVARRLWLVAHGWGNRSNAPRHRIRLSQDQLARMLGTTRTGVNKALRELERQGLMRLHYGEIELLDLVALRRGAPATEPAG